MPVGSTIELYTTVLGWFLYDAIWGIFVNSGIAIIPFVAVLIKTLLETRDTQWEVTADGLIRILETRLYTMLFVVFIAVQPMINVQPDKTTYTQYRCSVTESGNLVKTVKDLVFGDSKSEHDKSSGQFVAMLDGRTPQAPVWWYLATKLNHAVTQSARQELPCTADLRLMASGMSSLAVTDPLLRDELRDFNRDCWQTAINQYGRQRLPESELNERFRGGKINDDISWPGSDFFLSRSGFYDALRPTRSVDAFAYNQSRDEMIAHPVINDGGFPSCYEWWVGSAPPSGASTDLGLRQRLAADLRAGGAEDCEDCAGAWWNFWAGEQIESPTQRDDLLIRTALNNTKRNIELEMTNGNQEFGGNGASGLLNRVVDKAQQRIGSVGLAMGSAKKATETEIFRQTAPIIQAMILLVFTLSLPILMSISCYSLSSLMTLTLVQFSIIFWGFLFSLAAWLDNFLLSGTLGSADTNSSVLGMFGGGLGGAIDAASPILIMSWVTWALYTLVPLAFTYMLGAVGVRAGDSLAQSSGNASGGIGRQGGAVVGAAEGVATRGLSRRM